ncbi:MAG: CRISPR-associated endoribonuclease Cas6 [Lachnobacterium sp.]|nr:CRISPR-associated endoribonuclease Cas6 [Lachnobacterium sp.]
MEKDFQGIEVIHHIRTKIGKGNMQLVVHIKLEEPLVLPINYNHIIQAIIYRALSIMPDYADFLHESGYMMGNRQYKMFHFGQLKGKYHIQNKHIVFESNVEFEIRSPEPILINLLAEGFYRNGISFGEFLCHNIQMELYDYTVEEERLLIRMKSPVTVHSTDPFTRKSYYYNPTEPEFYEAVANNFYHKYQAYYGINPSSFIEITSVGDSNERKFVTNYQGSYITGWFSKFYLSGERKYLDFLYQTGLGEKNSQGFGMFEIL